MAKKTDKSVRIAKIRSTFCNDDNQKFADEIGISEQLASSICTGNKPAGAGTLKKILSAFPRVNRVWLFMGEGDMLRPEPSISAEVVNVATNNGGMMNQGKEVTFTGNPDYDRLITLLENKDRQIDRLISLLEEKYKHHDVQ